VLLVMISHLRPVLGLGINAGGEHKGIGRVSLFGMLGVELFFVLSGFFNRKYFD